MKPIFLLAGILATFHFYGQEEANLRIKSKYGAGTTILKGEQKIDKDALFYALRNNGKALSAVKKGMRQQSFSHIFAYAGLAMIGYPFGASILGSEQPQWLLIPAGTAVIFIGLPIFNGGTNKVQKGMGMYRENSDTAMGNRSGGVALALAAGKGSLGIMIKF